MLQNMPKVGNVGGGDGINVTQPNEVVTARQNAVLNITCQQKPRYIIHGVFETGTYAEIMYYFIDVEKETAVKRYGWYSNFFEDTQPFADCISNITDTSFTLNNHTAARTASHHVFMYY